MRQVKNDQPSGGMQAGAEHGSCRPADKHRQAAMAAQKNGKETAIHEWASWKNRGHTESWVGVGKTEEGLMLSFQGAYERKLGFRWLASRPIVKRAGEEAGKSPCRAATTGELNLPSLGATGHGESRRRQLGEPSGNHAKRPRAAARLVHLWAGIHRLVGARQPPPAALTPTLRQGYEERS